jgi:hypothetical protein
VCWRRRGQGGSVGACKFWCFDTMTRGGEDTALHFVNYSE